MNDDKSIVDELVEVELETVDPAVFDGLVTFVPVVGVPVVAVVPVVVFANVAAVDPAVGLVAPVEVPVVVGVDVPVDDVEEEPPVVVAVPPELVAVVVGLVVLLPVVATSVELVGLVVESVVVAALETPGIKKSEALLKATAIAKSVYLIFEENFLLVCFKSLVVIILMIPNILDFLYNQSVSEKSISNES